MSSRQSSLEMWHGEERFFLCMGVLVLESLWLKITRTGCLELEVVSQWWEEKKSRILQSEFSASRGDDFQRVLKKRVWRWLWMRQQSQKVNICEAKTKKRWHALAKVWTLEGVHTHKALGNLQQDRKTHWNLYSEADEMSNCQLSYHVKTVIMIKKENPCWGGSHLSSVKPSISSSSSSSSISSSLSRQLRP